MNDEGALLGGNPTARPPRVTAKEQDIEMKKMSYEKLRERHKLLNVDPPRYLAMVNEEIRADPSDPDGYFSRHFAWNRLGRHDLALEDLNKVLSLEERAINFRARGDLFHELGDHRKAIEDFNRAEALDPELWSDSWGPLFRADSYARLGNEEAALADCAKLKDDHWTPGMFGMPAGDKQQVIAEVRRRAAEARHGGR